MKVTSLEATRKLQAYITIFFKQQEITSRRTCELVRWKQHQHHLLNPLNTELNPICQ